MKAADLGDAIRFTCLCGREGFVFNDCEPPALGHVPPLCEAFNSVSDFKDAADYLKRCRLAAAH